MGKENTPHVGIYGRRNAGKSSLINHLAGQNIAIVSDTAGTTTDPVRKSFEITGFGPVVLIDTAGIDDVGELGAKRIEKTRHTIQQIDLALLVITHNTWANEEQQLIEEFAKYNVPCIIVHNKSDEQPLDTAVSSNIAALTNTTIIDYNTTDSQKRENLVKLIAQRMPPAAYRVPSLLGDLVSHGDIVLLITPIDVEAPAGRLILPQVQAIRDILDNDCVAIVIKEREVDAFLRRTDIRPKLAITDSSIFLKAAASIPPDIPLTGFSVILARQKGDFDSYLKGTPHISRLRDNDRVLLLESCTHHTSCDDIGRVKIPRWMSNFTGKKLEFDVVGGLDKLPRPLNDYSLVVQCGGCMITRKQLLGRLNDAVKADIPITNYGMAIAYMQGIYDRAIAPFTKQNDATDYL